MLEDVWGRRRVIDDDRLAGEGQEPQNRFVGGAVAAGPTSGGGSPVVGYLVHRVEQRVHQFLMTLTFHTP